MLACTFSAGGARLPVQAEKWLRPMPIHPRPTNMMRKSFLAPSEYRGPERSAVLQGSREKRPAIGYPVALKSFAEYSS
jgi:hypothetical protein